MQKNGEEPTCEEIAACCDVGRDKVAELLELIPQVCSLDSPVGENGADDLQMLIEDLQAPQPQEELVRQELKKTMDALLAQMTQRESQILRLRYGMDDGVSRSLQMIATELDISKERVRQIEKQAMDKLKILGADFGLEDFLGD